MRFRDERAKADALTPPLSCEDCKVPLNTRTRGTAGEATSGRCSSCAVKARNVAETGSPGLRRVWTIGRHQRRRLTGVSRSRAGR